MSKKNMYASYNNSVTIVKTIFLEYFYVSLKITYIYI